MQQQQEYEKQQKKEILYSKFVTVAQHTRLSPAPAFNVFKYILKEHIEFFDNLTKQISREVVNEFSNGNVESFQKLDTLIVQLSTLRAIKDELESVFYSNNCGKSCMIN